MSTKNGKIESKPDYERLAVIYRDYPEMPWCTHKAYVVGSGLEQAKAEAAELRKLKKRGLKVHIVRIGILEVVE